MEGERTVAAKKHERVYELHKQGLSVRQIANRVDLTPRSVDRVIKQKTAEEAARSQVSA